MNTTELDKGQDNVPNNEGVGETPTSARGLHWVLLLVFIALAFRISWMGDDATITLRHALNFTHGWGPGFNATESVQAYTHPLWFFIWSGLGTLTGEWIYSITMFSLAVAGGAVALVLWRTKTAALALAVMLGFTFSNAFAEYVTSGLENPLSYLLVGLIAAITVGRSRWVEGSWAVSAGSRPLGEALALGLLVALLGLNRLDLLLVAAPIGLLWAWQRRSQWKAVVVAAVAAVAPLLAWFAWAQSTYGSFFPNTYEAKRNVDIPQSELVAQGLRYLWISTVMDPVTTVVIVLAVILAFWKGSGFMRAGAIGVLAYLVYVVSVGGDFMVGRFLAVPFYLSMFTLVVMVTAGRLGENESWFGKRSAKHILVMSLAALMLFLALGLSGRPTTMLILREGPRLDWREEGVADEWGQYGQSRIMKTMLSASVGDPDGPPSLRLIRDRANNYERNTSGERLATPELTLMTSHLCGALGIGGVMEGPRTHIIDRCGLSDRFIAEQTFTPETKESASRQDVIFEMNSGPVVFRDVLLNDWYGGRGWRIAHLDRTVPEGYVQAVFEGNPMLVEDPALAQRLEELWRVIR